MNITQTLKTKNELMWLELGKLCELVNDPEKALISYENVLKHNDLNIHALSKIASIYRSKDQFNKVKNFI
jgi:hypothetical protein